MAGPINRATRSSPESEYFPFRDLPGEIRNKIYKILLCTFEPRYPTSQEIHEMEKAGLPTDHLPKFHEAPTRTTDLQHSIEPQILRSCRAVYEEAKYFMRSTNCFIKIIVKIPWEEISALVIAKRLPILKMDRKKVKDFKHCVMSHEITSPVPYKGRTFVILHRDLDLFCKGLADYKHTIPRHDEMVSHIVTLLNPYDFEDLPEFYTLKFQESLIAPYRTLRGFPHFAIKGVIPKELSRTVVKKITRSPEIDPDAIISELEALKTKGNDFFRSGDGTMASDTWCTALLKIRRLMSGPEGPQLRQAGGTSFMNHISSLKFDLNSNRAQNTIKSMRESAQKGDHHLVFQLGNNLRHAVGEAYLDLPKSTWQPSPPQAGKLAYREAVGYRLVGQWNAAERAIDIALGHIPNDAELRNEKERITQGKRCAGG